MRIYILLLNIICISLFSCQSQQHKVKLVSTIDSTLQVKATSILKSKLSEISAQSGQVIIMEVQTGQIKALVGLTRKDSANYQSSDKFSDQSPTSLMHPISLLAALETKKINLSSKINVGNGIYSVHGKELKDHNWQEGGYGEITLEQGLACNSNIATYKAMEKTFGNNPQSYFDLLAKMSYAKPDSIIGINNLKSAYFVTPKDNDWNNGAFAWFSIGYNQLITPIQTLTFYNAIANNGKMLQPLLFKDSTVIINSQIAIKSNIDSLKRALDYNITEGLGKPAYSNKVKIAGMQGTIQLENGGYIVEFCGYFPADNPQYTIIVSINKIGLPASGGLMAGDVFRQLVDTLNI